MLLARVRLRLGQAIVLGSAGLGVAFFLRHRVLRCSWLDRSGTDLDVDSGAAGVLKPAPVSVEALRDLAEYLWQFTAFNNADHVVLASAALSTRCTSIERLITFSHVCRIGSAWLSPSSDVIAVDIGSVPPGV